MQCFVPAARLAVEIERVIDIVQAPATSESVPLRCGVIYNGHLRVLLLEPLKLSSELLFNRVLSLQTSCACACTHTCSTGCGEKRTGCPQTHSTQDARIVECLVILLRTSSHIKCKHRCLLQGLGKPTNRWQ